MLMKLNLLLATLLLSATAAFAEIPKTGDAAPAFEGKDQDGNTVKLSDYAGKKTVLLYFYPKDFTGGCTAEACGFRDSIGELQSSNVKVIGVSFDSSDSHQKFIAKYNLPFPLIADTDGKIADTYGVRMQDRNMAQRVSFLIGLDGKIAHVTNSGKADVHLKEMKEAAAKLKS